MQLGAPFYAEEMPQHARAERLARGWIVGAVSTVVAAVSHSLAGGYQPNALSLGVAVVFAGMLGTLVIGLRPSLVRLALAVAGSQLAFHLMFSLLVVPAGAAGSNGGAGSMVGMSGMSAMSGMSGMDAAAPATQMTASAHLLDPGMWLAHGVAAAITIAFLRHAELALWNMLVRLIAPAVTRVAAATPTRLPEPPRSPSELPVVRPLSSRLRVCSASRRGPPLLSF